MLRLKIRNNLWCIIFLFLKVNNETTGTSQKGVLQFFTPHGPKIINGTAASLNETKHQVSIRRRRNDDYFFGTGHICGGSLISENVVLSAAHCFVNYDVLEPSGTFYPDDYFIAVMGNLDRFENNNNTLVFNFKRIIKRVEIFDLTTYDDDIVLIMLDGKVPALHPTVKPITLNNGPVKNNTVCQTTGWGLNEENYNPDILMTVNVPIIDFEDCREKTVYEDVLLPGMLCAGYLEGEKDACKGDSGGPLVCGGLQAGIVSWGNGCALPLNPGVYTNVTYYEKWILETVAKYNGTLPKFSALNGEVEGDDGRANNTEASTGDGVRSLKCSLILVNLMLLFIAFNPYQS